MKKTMDVVAVNDPFLDVEYMVSSPPVGNNHWKAVMQAMNELLCSIFRS